LGTAAQKPASRAPPRCNRQGARRALGDGGCGGSVQQTTLSHQPGQDTQLREAKRSSNQSVFHSVESAFSFQRLPHHRHGRAGSVSSTPPVSTQSAAVGEPPAGKDEGIESATRSRTPAPPRAMSWDTLFGLRQHVRLSRSPPPGPFLSPARLVCARRFRMPGALSVAPIRREEVARATLLQRHVTPPYIIRCFTLVSRGVATALNPQVFFS